MAPKRRRASLAETRPASNKSKRRKFILENVQLPEITTEGVVLVTGAGDVGQLGLGPDVLEKIRPAVVSLEEEVVDICAGGMHSVCLTKEGKVLTFGCNDEGALGRVTDGKEDAEFEAAAVELPGKVIQISAGDSHTAALLEDGRVFAWGTFRDSHGNMGMTIKGNEKLPYEIIKNVHVMKIASGADHLAFLTKNGEVYTCGCGEQGQLGRTTERGSSRTARNTLGKAQIAKLLQPASISIKPSLKLHFDNLWAGPYCTFVRVAEKDDVYAFGLNNYNQLGIAESIVPQYAPHLSEEFSKFKWSSIAGSQHHTIAVTDKGKVYAVGRKDYGRLGIGKDCTDLIKLKEVDFLKDHNVVDVACGSSTSFAINDKGELYAWGMGTNGQLGTGDDEDRYEPTLINSKQLVGRKVFRIRSGGQHTIMLALNPRTGKAEAQLG